MSYYLLPAEKGKEDTYRKLWKIILELGWPDWTGRFFIPKVRRMRKTDGEEWREVQEPLIPGKVLFETPDEKDLLTTAQIGEPQPVFRIEFCAAIDRLSEKEVELLKELTQNFRDPIGVSFLREINDGKNEWIGPLAKLNSRMIEINPQAQTARIRLFLGGEEQTVSLMALQDPGKEEDKERICLRNVVNLRKVHRWTQSQLAARIGTSQTMLARYERGANAMPIRLLLSLCEVFQRTPDELLGIDGSTSPEWSEAFLQRKESWGKYQPIIRKKRRKAGLSQAEVAAKVGASMTMYARYERGENEMPLRCLIRLCELYGVSAAELLGMTEQIGQA